MKLLTNEKTFIVQPSLACVLGVEEALLLQHLHYRLQQQDVLHNGEAWYCQSHANWAKQMPFWNVQKIKPSCLFVLHLLHHLIPFIHLIINFIHQIVHAIFQPTVCASATPFGLTLAPG